MRSIVLAALVAGGCGGSMISLLAQHGAPATLTPAHEVPLEVVTRKNTTVKDPLPVRGGFVEFGDLEAALGFAVSSATVPWAEQHMALRPEGWQLAVELISADAWKHGHEVTVALNARATLRTRTGNQFIAQTQTHCLRSAAVEPREASHVIFDCMARLGRELGGWLGGVSP